MFDHNNLLFVVSVDVAKERVFAEDFWGTLQTTIQYVPAKARWEVRSANPENGLSYTHETVVGAEQYSVWHNTGRNLREHLVRGAKRAINALIEAARERTGLYRLVDCGGHKHFAGHNSYGAFGAIIGITDALHLAGRRFYLCSKNDIRGHDRAFFGHDVLHKYGSKPTAALMPRGVRCGKKDRRALWFDVLVDGVVLHVRYDLDIRALQCSVRGNNDKWVTIVNIEYGALVATSDNVVENCCDYLGLSLDEPAHIYEDESFLCAVI